MDTQVTDTKRSWISRHPLALAAIIVAFLVAAAGAWWWQQIMPRPWQAVFLANNTVYFGHIIKDFGSEVVLKDVYYLESSAPLQVGATEKTPGQISLVKLGAELHGPTDEMRIMRKQVLFTEELKPDSKIVKAIEEYRLGATK